MKKMEKNTKVLIFCLVFTFMGGLTCLLYSLTFKHRILFFVPNVIALFSLIWYARNEYILAG